MSAFFHRWCWLLAVFGLGLAQGAPPLERTVPRIPVKPAPTTPAPPLLPDLAPVPGSSVEKPTAPIPSLPPNLPPLGLPSDGEQAPSFPDLPDLPEASIPPTPKPGTPAESDPATPPSSDPPAPGSTPPPPKPAPGLLFPVWHKSPKKARDLALAERRCLLVVFSSSGGAVGSGSKQLSDEVLARPDFNQFALAHLALANLFYTEGTNLPKYEDELAREDAMANFKEAFKVRGFPTAILFTPDGKEVDRWVGYRSGHALAYFQHLQQAVEGQEAVMFESERRREKLEAQGYRTWTSAQGLKRFAKLLEFDAHSALLRDESGSELKVDLKQLALPDREIITRRRLGRPLPKLPAPDTTTGVQ